MVEDESVLKGELDNLEDWTNKFTHNKVVHLEIKNKNSAINLGAQLLQAGMEEKVVFNQFIHLAMS